MQQPQQPSPEERQLQQHWHTQVSQPPSQQLHLPQHQQKQQQQHQHQQQQQHQQHQQMQQKPTEALGEQQQQPLPQVLQQLQLGEPQQPQEQQQQLCKQHTGQPQPQLQPRRPSQPMYDSTSVSRDASEAKAVKYGLGQSTAEAPPVVMAAAPLPSPVMNPPVPQPTPRAASSSPSILLRPNPQASPAASPMTPDALNVQRSFRQVLESPDTPASGPPTQSWRDDAVAEDAAAALLSPALDIDMDSEVRAYAAGLEVVEYSNADYTDTYNRESASLYDAKSTNAAKAELYSPSGAEHTFSSVSPASIQQPAGTTGVQPPQEGLAPAAGMHASKAAPALALHSAGLTPAGPVEDVASVKPSGFLGPTGPAAASAQELAGPAAPPAEPPAVSTGAADAVADAAVPASYSLEWPDPAPHLQEGVSAAAPGPRVNPKPAPGTLGGSCMTFQPPPHRSGQAQSPPKGEVVTVYHYNYRFAKWTQSTARVRLDAYPFQEVCRVRVSMIPLIVCPGEPEGCCTGDEHWS